MRSKALSGCGWYILSLALFYALKLAKISFRIYVRVYVRAYADVNNQSEQAQIHLHMYLYEKPRFTTGA